MACWLPRPQWRGNGGLDAALARAHGPSRQAERRVNVKTAWWFAGGHFLSGPAGPLEDPSRSTSKRKAMVLACDECIEAAPDRAADQALPEPGSRRTCSSAAEEALGGLSPTWGPAPTPERMSPGIPPSIRAPLRHSPECPEFSPSRNLVLTLQRASVNSRHENFAESNVADLACTALPLGVRLSTLRSETRPSSRYSAYTDGGLGFRKGHRQFG